MMDLADYFQFRASEMLVMARDIWQLNTLMGQECRHANLKNIFQQQNDPARHQISNLEQVVDQFGGIVGPDENPITLGILQAHRRFLEMTPPSGLIDLHNALEGDRVTHLMMAAYTGLISVAGQLGQNDIVRLLQENLQDEQRLCSALEGIVPELLKNIGGQQRQAA